MVIVFCGDSITAGLGVTNESYPVVVGRWLTQRFGDDQVHIVNASGTAHQLKDSLRDIQKIIDMMPDVVIIAHGPTEAVVRPRSELLKYVPPRWRRPGWLDPRPYYSRRYWKRLVQRIESGSRWRLKVALIRIFVSVK